MGWIFCSRCAHESRRVETPTAERKDAARARSGTAHPRQPLIGMKTARLQRIKLASTDFVSCFRRRDIASLAMAGTAVLRIVVSIDCME